MKTRLNLEDGNQFHQARKVLLGEPKALRLILAGCGGTGSWLAPAVVRVGKLYRELHGKDVEIIFVDPDKVEMKNVYRQNFCQAEVGRGKSECLATRYGLAWGIDVFWIEGTYKQMNRILRSSFQWLEVVLGCVDSRSARKEIGNPFGFLWRGWWIDSGNRKSSGQVVIGKVDDRTEMPGDMLPGYTGWLPSPFVQYPDLAEADPEVESEENVSDLSCADLALQSSQGMAINQRMAAEAADYLVRLLITQDLRKMSTEIDLESGVCRSRYITDENLKPYLPKPKEKP